MPGTTKAAEATTPIIISNKYIHHGADTNETYLPPVNKDGTVNAKTSKIPTIIQVIFTGVFLPLIFS